MQGGITVDSTTRAIANGIKLKVQHPALDWIASGLHVHDLSLCNQISLFAQKLPGFHYSLANDPRDSDKTAYRMAVFLKVRDAIGEEGSIAILLPVRPNAPDKPSGHCSFYVSSQNISNERVLLAADALATILEPLSRKKVSA